MRRSRNLFLAIAALTGLGVSGTASANVTGFDPSVQPGSSTSVSQAIMQDSASLTGATSAQFAFGGSGAPSPMGAGCNPDLSAVDPPYCTSAAPVGLTDFPTDSSAWGILTTGQINTVGSNFTQGDSTNEVSFDFASQSNPGGSPNRGTEAEDYTVVALSVSVPAGANCLSMDYRFLSEEYPQFVGSSFNDAFIAELDTTSWSVGTGGGLTRPNDFAADPAGDAVSVNGQGPTAMFVTEAAGTYFNAATGLVTTKTAITPGPHTIYLSMFDASDSILDSAVFLDRLRFISESSATCKPPLSLDPPDTPAAPATPSTPGSTVAFKPGTKPKKCGKKKKGKKAGAAKCKKGKASKAGSKAASQAAKAARKARRR